MWVDRMHISKTREEVKSLLLPGSMSCRSTDGHTPPPYLFQQLQRLLVITKTMYVFSQIPSFSFRVRTCDYWLVQTKERVESRTSRSKKLRASVLILLFLLLSQLPWTPDHYLRRIFLWIQLTSYCDVSR